MYYHNGKQSKSSSTCIIISDHRVESSLSTYVSPAISQHFSSRHFVTHFSFLPAISPVIAHPRPRRSIDDRSIRSIWYTDTSLLPPSSVERPLSASPTPTHSLLLVFLWRRRQAQVVLVLTSLSSSISTSTAGDVK